MPGHRRRRRRQGQARASPRATAIRDYGKKLPFTPKTVVPIASNTKLFTAVAAGLLVEEGKLDWDKPVRAVRAQHPVLQRRAQRHGDDPRHARRTAPASRATTRSGTSPTSPARSCSSGCSTWSRRSRSRSTFLYNNMMYAGAGYVDRAALGQDLGGLRARADLRRRSGMTSTRLLDRRHDRSSPTTASPSPSGATPSSSTRSRTTARPAGVGPAGVDQLEPRGHVAAG